MKEVIYSLSNREISLLIWISLIVLFVIIKTKCLNFNSIISFLKALFPFKLNVLYLAISTYLVCIIFIFNKIGLWENLLYKDFIVWFFSTGVVLFYSASEMKSSKDFKLIFIKLFKTIVIVEFIINLYNFSLFKEILFIPFVTLIAVTHKYSEIYKDKKDYADVEKLLRYTLSFVGYIILIFVTYKTFTAYKALFTIYNLKSLLLPIIFTILFLPMVYLITVLMKYEIIFQEINWYQFIESERKLEIKKAILRQGKLNLDALNKIRNWEKGELKNNSDIRLYFKNLVSS